MQYLNQNDNIDPVIINANMREIQTLVGKAAIHNKELQIRGNMLSVMLNNFVSSAQHQDTYGHIVQEMSTGQDVFYFPSLVLGQGTLTNTQLEAGVIGLGYSSEHSRIASQTNNFGEAIPSLSTVYSAAGVVLEHPELIFSADAAWAQLLDAEMITITAAFPPAIRNNYNYVKMMSILPETTLELTSPGISDVRNNLVCVPEAYFNSQMVLKSYGVRTGLKYLHTAGLVDIGFRKFFDQGTILKDVAITAGAYTTLTAAELDFAFDLNKERIGQVARIQITQYDAATGGNIVGTVYNSDTDDYPLSSSIAIHASAVRLQLSIVLRKYANSSPLLRGVTLNLTRTP